MSTHNICIRREIRKILCGYPRISVAMPIIAPDKVFFLFFFSQPKIVDIFPYYFIKTYVVILIRSL